MHIYAFYPNHSDWIQNLCQQICPHHCGSRPRHSLCPDRYCSSSDFWSLRAAMQNDPQCKYLPLKLKSCLWNFNAKLVQNQVVDSDLKPLMTPSVLIFVIASETLDSSASISWARLPILNCTKRWTIYRTFHKKTSFLWSCIASACTHWNSGLINPYMLQLYISRICFRCSDSSSQEENASITDCILTRHLLKQARTLVT